MLETRSPEQRRELGAFLRAQRERLEPAAIGLPAGRRRTPGLRREEVAQLCGLSTTWYTWIEQGRDVSMSPLALARVAATLRLGRAERGYLFALAGKRDPDQQAAEGEDVPAAVAACVAAMAAPAYVLDRNWTARCWNAAAARLFTGWLDVAATSRNLLRFVFLAPVARTLICDWESRARRVVAEFRAGCGPHVTDPALRRLTEEMRRDSTDFAAFWDQYDVLGREGGERRFNHPRDGALCFAQVTFEVAGRADLKLTMLVAAAALPDAGAGSEVTQQPRSAPARIVPGA